MPRQRTRPWRPPQPRALASCGMPPNPRDWERAYVTQASAGSREDGGASGTRTSRRRGVTGSLLRCRRALACRMAARAALLVLPGRLDLGAAIAAERLRAASHGRL